MCSQWYSAFCVKNSALEWQCFPAALFSLEDGSTTEASSTSSDVPYPYGEIEHDVIAAVMRTRVQIPHKRFLEKAFRWAQNANVHHLVSSF